MMDKPTRYCIFVRINIRHAIEEGHMRPITVARTVPGLPVISGALVYRERPYQAALTIKLKAPNHL